MRINECDRCGSNDREQLHWVTTVKIESFENNFSKDLCKDCLGALHHFFEPLPRRG